MSSIRATVTASRAETRILVKSSTGDLLIARLDPIDQAQRFALRALLEAVALWTQQRVDVVLCADDCWEWREAGLLDAFDVARETLLLDVELVPLQGRPQRAKQLVGLGSFAGERRRLRALESR